MAQKTEPSQETPKQSPDDRRTALKNSAEALKETQLLIISSHFSGSKAHKVIGCLNYLRALEQQIRSELQETKE